MKHLPQRPAARTGKLPGLALVLGAAWCTGLTPASAALRVYPDKVSLDSSAARQSIVVQQVSADGVTTDVTASATLELAGGAPVKWDAASFSLTPSSDGEVAVEIKAGGESISLPVTVKNAATARPVSFRLDVEPVFMRSGCNSGSCHGSARGQDGFRLSLFGFDPAGDYFRLTREYVGRRVDLAVPEQSLLLEKATGAVTHTGGESLKKGSPYYHTLKDWITAGAPDDPEMPFLALQHVCRRRQIGIGFVGLGHARLQPWRAHCTPSANRAKFVKSRKVPAVELGR